MVTGSGMVDPPCWLSVILRRAAFLECSGTGLWNGDVEIFVAHERKIVMGIKCVNGILGPDMKDFIMTLCCF